MCYVSNIRVGAKPATFLKPTRARFKPRTFADLTMTCRTSTLHVLYLSASKNSRTILTVSLSNDRPIDFNIELRAFDGSDLKSLVD